MTPGAGAVRARVVGVALSGGVARGPAHVGVLAALEAAAVPIDIVTGTSAGAIAGALYCAGLSVEAVKPLLAGFGWQRLARPVWPRYGFLTFAPLEAWLVAQIGDVEFQQLPRPLGVVATDIGTGEPVLIRQGRVASAVRASCSVPGLFEPVQRDGLWLCDGGASNNLPCAAAREMGAEYVIGVDLFVPALRPRLGPLSLGLWALENFVRRSGGGQAAADWLIMPDVAGATYLRLGRHADMVARGALAAEGCQAAIRAALGMANQDLRNGQGGT